MRTFDLTPLFRSTVGFDHLSRALDAATQAGEAAAGHPPYNIEKLGEDAYRVTVAVAGLTADDIEIVATEGALTIRADAKPEDEGVVPLYRGIPPRAFERRFHLADYVQVTGARLENGLLQVDLARLVPEDLKPRRVAIDGAPAARAPLAAGAITDKAA